MSAPILLVEDEENDVFFMKRAMKQAGITHPLRVAEDGQAAIDYLEEALRDDDKKIPLPCLVLLDLKLPRVMGLDVLKWIRRQPELQTMIVIIFTSSKLSSDIDAAYRLGANSYLVKSGNADKLSEIARLINDYWLNVNQPPLESTAPPLELPRR